MIGSGSGIRFRMTVPEWRGIAFPGLSFRKGRMFSRGQATLEILVVMFLLIPLIFGAIELSRGVAVRAALDSGVGVAARALAIDPTAWDWSGDVVAATVAQNVFGSTGLGTVNFAVADGPGAGAAYYSRSAFAALAYGTPFCARGWVAYTPLIPLLSPGTITIRVQHCGVVERV